MKLIQKLSFILGATFTFSGTSTAITVPVLNTYQAQSNYFPEQRRTDFLSTLQTLPVPTTAEDFFNQGSFRSSIGDYTGAIEDFTQAIRLQSDYTDAYLFRSNVHLYLENYDQAVADSTEVIRLDSNNALAYNNRCYGLARGLGDYQKAISDCNKAIQLGDNNPGAAAFYSSRCLARAGLGDKTALDDCAFSLKIDPNYIYGYEDRGLARSILRDKKGAIADLRIAARLFKEIKDTVSFERVQKLIRTLEQ
ncbi:tetratricopeptide repeat protein [Nostoc parmelioides]|uniref:Tetratricopeptide repeat protein n=1 Tax=Nostoc parmelioides FACHB-3921 TaxID=2692909 RepID=A0ABR8BLM0_9NOSO|nr:tetratricopeptide repeat protein [Nostoc parmelioides]MBD2254776.1 tetratricopeptide repeat protein [Nostoc parmelioides FACHB-3921]